MQTSDSVILPLEKPYWKHVTQIRNINIVLVKWEKAILVNSEFYKSMQPFTETMKKLLFEFNKFSIFSSLTY